MPKTKPINDFLIQEMRRRDYHGPMWIGMHDSVDEGVWTWEDGSDVVSWGNMISDGWFRGIHDCMALNSKDGNWQEYRCTEEHSLKQFFGQRKPPLWPSGKTLVQRPGGAGSIPDRVKPRTLKLVLAADPPNVWLYGLSAKSGRPRCQDNVTGCGVCKRFIHHSVAARFQFVPSAVSDITS
ncbi:hypothetical protein ElyMa_000952800 [Elysia marginata]|uniref:C-type lectin domain-containing protein n=1 Tax=Elysia marginata TaxID=1093978 RepID=A0AAV4HC44_9GAST|nr:hypothetical protein ElyMa_000952800 [Elysia marginata]